MNIGKRLFKLEKFHHKKFLDLMIRKLGDLIESKNEEIESLKFESKIFKRQLQTLEFTHDELKLKYGNLEEKLNKVNTDYDAILNSSIKPRI